MSRIACVGLNVVDKYIHQQLAYPGGNEFNVSVFASWLKADSAFIGCFGNDFFSGFNHAVLSFYHVDTTRCRYYQGACGYALVNLVDGDRVFLGGNHGGVTGLHPVVLDENDLAYLKGYDVAVSDRASRMKASEFSKLLQAGIPLAYDFSDITDDQALSDIAASCKYAFFSCSHLSVPETEKLLKSICPLGPSYAFASRGGDGALLYNGQNFYSVKPPEQKIVDTMGAGDSFLTAFLVRSFDLYAGNPTGKAEIMDCLRFASDFATHNCSFYGSVGHPMPLPAAFDTLV